MRGPDRSLLGEAPVRKATLVFGRRRNEPMYDPDERFFGYIENDDKGCWIWKGAQAGGGYGTFFFEGKQVPAHRRSWEIQNGPVPKGLWVLHKCDVRACVNPDHLFLGTRQDNMDDMKAKGRQSRKPSRGRQILFEEDIIKIRHLYSRGMLQREIGNLFGVGQAQISKILLHKTESSQNV